MCITSQEIDTQPSLWRKALNEIGPARDTIVASGERVLSIGCGTSAYIASSYAQIRERAGHGTTDSGPASEPRAWRGWDRVVAISRSGTTSEVIHALKHVPAGTRKVVVTGDIESPAAQLADEVLDLSWADEQSVVPTRFPTTFLIQARAALGHNIKSVALQAEKAIASPLPVRATDYEHFVFLGANWAYGLAQEAALKVREIAQAWTESYHLYDYRHGPIAVAHEKSLVWMLGSTDESLANDIRATGATVILGLRDPLVDLVQAQRMAVQIAEHRGLDPDATRGQARSIILE
ncbi:SIS domain-containing protein [soil metagenome]